MVVVHRAHGFRFVIYTLDHQPAHVYVTGPGQAKVNLLGPDGRPELVYSIGIKRPDLRRLMAEVVVRRDGFLQEWSASMASPVTLPTDAGMDAAEAQGRTMLDGPRAVSAQYEPATGRIVVELANGCAYSFPVHLVQDLQRASQEDLASVEVDGMGLNLHWPALDAGLLVPALVSGIFGTRA